MKHPQLLKVLRVTPQGKDAILLSFALDATQKSEFNFKPGQYLTVLGGPVDNQQWRCFSLTSDPSDPAVLSVLVRRVSGGLVSNWLCEHVHAGQYLQVLPPAGHFMLRQPGQPAVFFAGGSGIAPIYSLVRQALANNASKICLFYANRDHGTAMLLEELEALQRSYGQRMDLRCWYDVHHGLPTVQALEACTEEFESNDVYLCGPEPFMGAVQSALLSVGVKLDHIRREEFSQDSIDEEPLGHTEFNQSSKTRLTVRIKGQVHQLDVCKTDTLLAAMIKSGLPAPHACKVGECASCMCHIESGDVDRLSNSVLDDDDVAAGWLVACRTRAISDEVSIRYG